MTSAALTGLCLTFAATLGAPFAVYFLARRRMTLSWLNIRVGIAVFVLFAVVLEQLLHFTMHSIPAANTFLKTNSWGLVFYGSLAAGLFEEVGRYVGMRFFVRPTGNPGTATAYGLGHGGIEALLIGAMAQIQGIVFAILLNLGKLDSLLAGSMPPAALAELHGQFANLTFEMAMVGGFERLLALALQIALSFVVWHAVEARKIWLLPVAIGLHAAADFPALMIHRGIITSIFVTEALSFAVLIAVVLFVRFLPKNTAS